MRLAFAQATGLLLVVVVVGTMGFSASGLRVTAAQKSLAPAVLDRVWMTSASDGWAESQHVVWRTSDGGRKWRAALVVGSTLSAGLTAVLGTEHVAVLTQVGTGVSSTLEIEETEDGGLSWERHPLRVNALPSQIQAESLDAVSPTRLFVLVRTELTMNNPSGVLLESSDAGLYWRITSAVTTAPGSLPSAIGSISFSDAADGWLSASRTTTSPPALYRTSDGGSWWAVVPLPAESGGGRLVPLDQPRLVASGRQWLLVAGRANARGVLGATGEVLVAPHGAQVQWQVVGSCVVDLDAEGGLVAPVFVGLDSGWEWKNGRLLRTPDEGKRWVPLPTSNRAGAFPEGALLELDFVSPRRGWALVTTTDSASAVFQSTDGGMLWHRVFPS